MKHAIVPIFTVLLLLAGIAFGIWGWRYFTAETRGKVEAKETVESGDFRLHSYNHFYELCAEIQKTQATLAEQEAILSEMAKDDRGYMRQRRNVAAIRAQVSRLAADYNADAAKEETVGKFRAANLPAHISTKGTISCGP